MIRYKCVPCEVTVVDVTATNNLRTYKDGGRISKEEGAPGTHLTGSLVIPSVGLEAVVKRKIPSPPPGIEP
jgi:hypothetical protein